jgi:hypothetical protein
VFIWCLLHKGKQKKILSLLKKKKTISKSNEVFCDSIVNFQ